MEDPQANAPIDSPAGSFMDPVAALSQVQDDVAERLEAHQWAADSLLHGHTPEELLETMLVQGWDHDTAAEIIESARIQTRRERGVVTRDDIVRDLDVEYRRATSAISMFLFGGLLGRAARTFFAALRTSEKLKRLSGKK
jgi:hypothetical protein